MRRYEIKKWNATIRERWKPLKRDIKARLWDLADATEWKLEDLTKYYVENCFKYKDWVKFANYVLNSQHL